MTKYTRTVTESVVMWRWRGPEDNRELRGREFFESYLLYAPGQYETLEPASGDWIIDRGDNFPIEDVAVESRTIDVYLRYEVITDAEKQVQGWEKMHETK